MSTFQEIVDSIARLSSEELDRLFEVVRQRRIQKPEAEILASRQELKQAIADGTAKRGGVRELIAELRGDEDASDSQ